MRTTDLNVIEGRYFSIRRNDASFAWSPHGIAREARHLALALHMIVFREQAEIGTSNNLILLHTYDQTATSTSL